MKLRGWSLEPSFRFHVVAGLCDGILTALTLGAARLFDPDVPMSLSLAWRVATAGAVSGMFLFFVAHYAELRRQLVEAERQLNLTSHGRLATTRLGHEVLQEAALGAVGGGACSFLGAMYPLLIGAILPQAVWVAIGAALGGLGVLGVCLARSFHGNALGWTLALVAGGVCFTFIGLQLRVV